MIQQVFDDKKFTGIRLPTNVVPSHYELKLKPDLEKLTFSGTVKISFSANEANKIVLNVKEVEITDAQLEDRENGDVQIIDKVTYTKATETAIFDFPKAIPANGILHLSFNGILNDKLKGFYRSSFEVDGVKVNAATTQFESADARRCFPCWDEPAVKATFSVNLVVNPKMKIKDREYEVVALSNGQELSRTPVGELVDVKYATTPIMSTYLLAFIVGPFEYIEANDGKRPVRVYTTPGKKEQGRFALDLAVKSLAYYENYFGIDYPLAKMDLIGIPDFNMGAMENWGLVTFREIRILVDKDNTSLAVKQCVDICVTHELAHQWFGNLVTMEWWTHLWLKEGFASFMVYLCTDSIYPEYDLWTQFITEDLERALNLDALHNSHAIEVAVKHPSEVEEIFDAISYSKGASVIRMLYNYIGDESFRKGMKDYLTKFSYKNTFTEDLWDCLGRSSGKPVAEIMSGWTAKKGFPWVSVKYSEEGESIKLTMTQNKFTSDGKLPAAEADYKWSIPISYATGANPKKAVSLGLLTDREAEFVIPSTDSWIKLNLGSTGLYRVAYPSAMREKLYSAISDQSLTAIDRLNLQTDFFALCQAGKISTVDYLKLLVSFEGEENSTVWKCIDSSLSKLSSLLTLTDYNDKLYVFGRSLYSKICKKLTWDARLDEKPSDGMTRAIVVGRFISFEDKEVIMEALKRFQAHFEKKVIIPVDLRRPVYKAVAIHGSEAQFESLLQIHKQSTSPEERNDVAYTLGFTKDANRLKKAIDFIMSDEVRLQDKPHAFFSVCSSNPEVGWEFLKQNKDFVRQNYGTGILMCSLVKYCTENFGTEEKAQEIAKFFEENKFPGAERSVLQSLETIRLRADWLARDSQAIKAHLSAFIARDQQ